MEHLNTPTTSLPDHADIERLNPHSDLPSDCEPGSGEEPEK